MKLYEEENDMSKIKVNLFTRKFEMCELVYNMEKKRTQIVLAKIPFCKRGNFGVPKLERAYICGERDSNSWTVESVKNLRPATVFEK